MNYFVYIQLKGARWLPLKQLVKIILSLPLQYKLYFLTPFL